MTTKKAFTAGAGFGVAMTLATAALFSAVGAHAPAFAAPPVPTLPNAANQRNEIVAELRAVREAIEKQTALLEARLPKPQGESR